MIPDSLVTFNKRKVTNNQKHFSGLLFYRNGKFGSCMTGAVWSSHGICRCSKNLIRCTGNYTGQWIQTQPGRKRWINTVAFHLTTFRWRAVLRYGNTNRINRRIIRIGQTWRLLQLPADGDHYQIAFYKFAVRTGKSQTVNPITWKFNLRCKRIRINNRDFRIGTWPFKRQFPILGQTIIRHRACKSGGSRQDGGYNCLVFTRVNHRSLVHRQPGNPHCPLESGIKQLPALGGKMVGRVITQKHAYPAMRGRKPVMHYRALIIGKNSYLARIWSKTCNVDSIAVRPAPHQKTLPVVNNSNYSGQPRRNGMGTLKNFNLNLIRAGTIIITSRRTRKIHIVKYVPFTYNNPNRNIPEGRCYLSRADWGRY